jgi:dGTP triphosphohydrolase
MRERHLLNTIQSQADKIKELEADWLDEYTKGILKTAEIENLKSELQTLKNIQNYLEDRLKDNKEFQQVIKDLEGGNEGTKTAVEWLADFFESGVTSSEEWTRAKKQAKEMEKQQIIDAYKEGNHSEMRGGKFINPIAEQYYNETFKSE